MKRHKTRRRLPAIVLIGLLFLLPACGGSGGGGLFDGLGPTEFWAVDMNTDEYYQLSAREAAAGLHCRVFVEAGRVVSQGAIDNIVRQFDNVIYPAVSAAFGDPPTPGVDGDPRITLLLLEIPQTTAPDGGVVAGYFTSINEFTQEALDAAGIPDKSNAREMIYLDASFPAPASAKSLRLIAHEFQHMVHWEQKTHRLSTPTNTVIDDTWLNEAMSESAPLFCGYGPDNDRADFFARNPSDSLTIWDSSLADYSAVYMWSQYLYDRYPRTLFRSVLLDPAVGVDSVSNVLAFLSAPNTSTTFAGLFRDWTMANIVAADPVLLDAAGLLPQWRYDNTSLASMFTATADRVNPAETRPLRQWSADYAMFRRFTAPLSGTVSWTLASGQTSASFFSAGDNTVTPDVTPGSVLPYTNTGYLVVRNESGFDNTAPDPAPIAVTPSVLLGALMEAPVGIAARPAAVTASGEPHMKCGIDRLERRERAIRARGLRVRF